MARARAPCTGPRPGAADGEFHWPGSLEARAIAGADLDPRLRPHRPHLQATRVTPTALRRTPRPLTRPKGPLKDPVRLPGHVLTSHGPPACNRQPRPGSTSDRAGRAPPPRDSATPTCARSARYFGGRGRLCQRPPLFDNGFASCRRLVRLRVALAWRSSSSLGCGCLAPPSLQGGPDEPTCSGTAPSSPGVPTADPVGGEWG
jgi:hypothetical protein